MSGPRKALRALASDEGEAAETGAANAALQPPQLVWPTTMTVRRKVRVGGGKSQCQCGIRRRRAIRKQMSALVPHR